MKADFLDFPSFLSVDFMASLKNLPIFIEESLLLHAWNDHNTRARQHVFQGKPRVLDEAARKGFHADDADTFRHGFGNNLFLRGRFKKTEAEHNRLKEVVLQDDVQDVQAVTAQSEMADQPLFLGLPEPLQAPPGEMI